MENFGFSREIGSSSFKSTSDSRTDLESFTKDLKISEDEQNKIELIVNYFPIEISTQIIYHYDIEISKIVEGKNDDRAARNTNTQKKYKCLNTKIKRNVVEKIVATKLEGIRPAFDGEKNLYTSKPLPKNLQETFKLIIDINGRSVTYEVNIKPVNKEHNVGSLPKNSISLEPLYQLLEEEYNYIPEEIQIAVMAIETIIRHGPAQHLIPVGREFYQKSNDDEKYQLSGGLEIWFGHHQGVQLTEKKLMLNIDCSAKPFYKNCSVIDFMLEVLYSDSRDKEETLRQIRRLTTSQQNTLIKELKNVNIRVTHLQQEKRHRISSVTSNSANETFFNRKIDEKEIRSSVSEYFESQYNKLNYPNLPCLDVSTGERACYLPMEVCEIVEGQHYNKKLSEKQTEQMIQFTAQPPAERFQQIQNLLQVVLRDFCIFSREFKIRINPNPVRLVGSILSPPVITYSADQEFQPSNGRWNMRDKQFLEGVKIGNWMILNLSSSQYCNKNALQKLQRMFFNVGKDVGLTFSNPPIIKTNINCNDNVGDIIRKEKITQPNLQLIIVVLPTRKQNTKIYRENHIYRDIKTIAETELGIMTQCVKDSNISDKKCTPQLISNICLKINAKMGGVNNSLLLKDDSDDVMIIGADCCHPSPGEDNQYSTAALVGNLDHFFGRYKASVRAQKPSVVNRINSGREIIIDIKEMMKELLIAYRENSHCTKPEKIIFYRDGVSEGDFDKLLNYELVQIRDALDEVYEDGRNKIPITFIVVRKRHHARFNVVNRKDGVGKKGNMPPGTIVDSNIVHPFFIDFFLCSQLGIKGTSKPAHYTVINDDNDFDPDEIQYLTYNLCHNSARSTTSISVPSSVKYADLAAARAKDYLISKNIDMSSSDDPRHQLIIEESIREAISVVENMENSMYFI